MVKNLVFLFFFHFITTFSITLTLEQAIELGFDNSKEIMVASKQSEATRLQLRSAFKEALLDFTYDVQYQQVEGGSGSALVSNIVQEGWSDSLSITQPLFTGGAIIGAIKAAKINDDTQLLNFALAQRDTRLDIIRIYSDIVQNEKDLLAFEASNKELKEQYEMQKAQLRLKLITKADLLKTEYSLLELEANILATENKIKIGKDRLKLKLQIPRDEELNIVKFTIPDSLLNDLEYEKDVEIARNYSINALIARKNVELADANSIITRSTMLPQVQAFASKGNFSAQSTSNPAFKQEQWRGGVKFQWDAFQFGKDLDSYRASVKLTEAQEIQEEIVKDSLELELTTAYLELIRLEKVKKSNYQAMLAATENYKIDKARHGAGVVSTIDFLISETQMTNSNVAYNKSLYDYYVAFEIYRSLLL